MYFLAIILTKNRNDNDIIVKNRSDGMIFDPGISAAESSERVKRFGERMLTAAPNPCQLAEFISVRPPVAALAGEGTRVPPLLLDLLSSPRENSALALLYLLLSRDLNIG
ncbi:hypothetical protein CEXT_168481 [Caerostris extrusa]|uniref:Uncharacterized protein n=1 Tax=Caerostris extrusa TaxID=172846 RepID=A0AAV4N8A5_CAEEX|nr:hypothetical protein CEXT_168481 [Caerostris extrusa]